MILIIILCALLTTGYVSLMIAYRKGWKMQRTFRLPAEYRPQTFISIIIPARNERANIGGCIDAILAQKYPSELYEIIVVDDHSDDGTPGIIKEYTNQNVRYIALAEHLTTSKKINSYKKAALAAGIAQSKGKLIVTTDADCIAPNRWLLHIAAKFEQDHPAMIIAPVIYTVNSSVLQLFQQIDFMSMQGITVASLNLKLGNMSNGANLAFTREAYDTVDGYKGIDQLASGDDYLLMMKIHKQYPAGITYLKSQYATVRTLPQRGWLHFLQQRIRWASKSGKYSDKKLTAILLLVYLFNCALLGVSVAGMIEFTWVYVAVAMFAFKVIFELIFLYRVSRFFKKEWTLRYFVVLQPLHIAYIVVAGLLGLVGGYTWKGRKVK